MAICLCCCGGQWSQGHAGWSGGASGPIVLPCWSWPSSHCALVQITHPACTTVWRGKIGVIWNWIKITPKIRFEELDWPLWHAPGPPPPVWASPSSNACCTCVSRPCNTLQLAQTHYVLVDIHRPHLLRPKKRETVNTNPVIKRCLKTRLDPPYQTHPKFRSCSLHYWVE